MTSQESVGVWAGGGKCTHEGVATIYTAWGRGGSKAPVSDWE